MLVKPSIYLLHIWAYKLDIFLNISFSSTQLESSHAFRCETSNMTYKHSHVTHITYKDHHQNREIYTQYILVLNYHIETLHENSMTSTLIVSVMYLTTPFLAIICSIDFSIYCRSINVRDPLSVANLVFLNHALNQKDANSLHVACN